jgi:hypothetical protein
MVEKIKAQNRGKVRQQVGESMKMKILKSGNHLPEAKKVKNVNN